MKVFGRSLEYRKSLKEYLIFLLKHAKSLKNGTANFVIHSLFITYNDTSAKASWNTIYLNWLLPLKALFSKYPVVCFREI